MTDRSHYQEMGQRIRTVRRARGITQAQLGACIDRHQSTIIAMEHGRISISPAHLGAICVALDVSVTQLRSADWRRLCNRGVSLGEAL